MSEENVQTEEAVQSKKRQIVNPTDKMFYTGKAVRKNTVFGFIVEQVVEKPGITAEELKNLMMEEFTPQKSETFGPGYCQAYIRGSVKEGYCHTDEDQGAQAEQMVEPAPVKRAAAGEGSGAGVTPAAQEIIDHLKAQESQSATITELMAALDKPKRNISTTLRAMEKREFVVVSDVMDETGEKVVDKNVVLGNVPEATEE